MELERVPGAGASHERRTGAGTRPRTANGSERAFFVAIRTRTPCGYNVVMVRTEQVLDSWKSVRQDSALAVEDFPAADFDFRPAPETMTFGDTARHILTAGDGLTGMLLAGEEHFMGPDFRDRLVAHARKLPPDAGPAALAAALRESVEQRTAALAAKPADFFARMVTRMDGQRVTRLEMVQSIKEHELTHRAHLFLCLRMKGIVPATTRRRMAKPAAK